MRYVPYDYGITYNKVNKVRVGWVIKVTKVGNANTNKVLLRKRLCNRFDKATPALQINCLNR